MRRFLVVAGEPSGDAHAALAVAAVRAQSPEVSIDAVGGVALDTSGAHVRWPIGGLSARGFTEALSALPAHLGLYRELSHRLRAGEYDAVMLVDYPGFNLRLAGAARRRGVPVLYYVAPQLWAWGGWRMGRLRRDVTQLATILPFEAPYFAARGVPSTFVGHPLLDVTRPDRRTARRALGLADDDVVLGLFPGSRADEVARHWVPFRDAASLLTTRHPGLKVITPLNDPRTAFAAADAALCKSGTGTLEAALSDVPMVVAYRMSALTHAMARRLVRIPRIGLVNIVADAAVAPELIQRDVNAAALADAVDPLLDRAGKAARTQREGLARVRQQLGQPGAAGRVADLLLGMAA